jgi:transglutaminase-like putative cysteine protease
MKRGVFLRAAAALPLVSGSVPLPAFSQSDPFDPKPGAWRTFEVTTDVTLAPGELAQAWIPVPSFRQSSWMLPGKSTWHGNTNDVELAVDRRWNAAMVHAQWPPNKAPRRLIVKSLVSTRNLDVDVRRPGDPKPLTPEEVALYTAPTKDIPTGGLVKQRADRITAGAATDLEKARKIYGWVVVNTYRKPATRGCGLGNVTFLLQTGDLGGKCADINGLAVGLARASGLPARDLYGVRVAPSEFGYKSLGVHSPNVTKAQHCRAEVFLAGYGWVPMDPADVRKVMLEEPPGHLAANNPKVVDARETLFGAWEGNYMAYNDAADVSLPGSSGAPVPFLMYPQAEINGIRLDSLDAATFTYQITAREV